jgi:hypothetical protein
MRRAMFVLVAAFIALCGAAMLRPHAWVMVALVAMYMTALGGVFWWGGHPRLRLLAVAFTGCALTFAVYAVRLYPL